MGIAGEALDDENADGFLLGEIPVYVDDADREETRFVAQGGPGALIDVDGSMRGEAVQDPEVAVADGVRNGEEPGMERYGLFGLW